MSSFRNLASMMLPALFTAAACSDTGAGPDVQLLAQITSVEVIAPPVLEVGTHGQVRVVLRDSKGQPILGPLVMYSSADTSVVQVDQGGRLTATSPGMTEVSAKAGSKQGKSTVRVTGKPGSTATQVRVSPTRSTAQSGEQLQFSAEVLDGSGTVLLDRSVFWWSADTRIATVDEAGLVTGLDAGTALINATSDGVTGSAELTVEAAPPTEATAPGRVADLTGVGSSTSEITMRFTEVNDGTGQPANYQVRIGPAPSTNWGAMTPVAAGTCAGVVPGISVGQSLTCTAAGLSAGTSYDIQVVAYRGSMADGTAVFGELSNSARYATQASAETASVTISPRDATLTNIGATHQFTTTVRDGSGNVVTNPGVTWASANTGVATVNSTGLVTARGAGIALITAVAACCGTDTAAVRVELPSQGGIGVWRGNEPVGFRTLSDKQWTTLANIGDGWSTRADGYGSGTAGIRIVARPDEPTGVGYAQEIWHAEGHDRVNSAGRSDFNMTNRGVSRVYVSYIAMHPVSWVEQDPGTKFWWFEMGRSDYTPRAASYTVHFTAEPHGNPTGPNAGQWALSTSNTWNQPGYADQWPGANFNNMNPAAAVWVPGKWHQVEFDFDMGTFGQRNGRLRMWIDGVLVADWPNADIPTDARYFWNLHFSHTWGGGQMQYHPVDNRYYISRTYISVPGT
jgi:hypothetical protein